MLRLAWIIQKKKVNHLDVGKLRTVSLNLKEISDVIKKVVKNTNFNGLKNKVSNLERKISEGTTLIYINLHNTGKQNFEKKNTRC